MFGKNPSKELTPFWCLFILTGLNLFNYFDRYVLSSTLVPIKAELGLSDGQLGSLSTAFLIGYFVSSPFFGYLGDRFNRKWLISVGVFVWSAATFGTGFALGFLSFMALRVLVGFGEASYATISPSLITDVFPSQKRNNALTIFYVAIPVGSALGFMFGGVMSESFDWRLAFMVAGAPGLILMLSLIPFKEPRRGQSDTSDANKDRDSSELKALPDWKDVFSLFKIKEFALVCWGYAAYTFALGAYAHWGPTFLHRTHGVSNKDASLFFGGVLVVSGLVGTLIGGLLATKLFKKHPSGYAWVLTAATFLTVPTSLLAFWSPNVAVSEICMALAMLFAFLPTGPVNTLILETVPPTQRASAMALSLFVTHLFGDMWSPAIVGALSDTWGSLRPAISILPIAFLVGALFWLRVALRQQKSGRLVRGNA